MTTPQVHDSFLFYVFLPLIWIGVCAIADMARTGSPNLQNNIILMFGAWFLIPLIWSLSPLVWFGCLVIYPIFGTERLFSLLMVQAQTMVPQLQELTQPQKPLSNKFSRKQR